MLWWPLCVLLLGLVASACGGAEERAVADDGLLLAYEAGNHQHRYGGRVFGDGRYELYSTADPMGEPDWKAYEPFTPEQVGEIREMVDEALAAGLPDRISAGDPPPPDATTARFTLPGREIVVGNWPAGSPAELERVLDRIAALRRRPPVPSTWRLWSRGELVALEVRCEIGEVAELDRLRNAIFQPSVPSASDVGADAPDPPDGTPLVSVTFATPNGDEVLAVYADGRRVDRAGAGEERVRELGADRLAAIRSAVADTDWAALPSRLC